MGGTFFIFSRKKKKKMAAAAANADNDDDDHQNVNWQINMTNMYIDSQKELLKLMQRNHEVVNENISLKAHVDKLEMMMKLLISAHKNQEELEQAQRERTASYQKLGAASSVNRMMNPDLLRTDGTEQLFNVKRQSYAGMQFHDPTLFPLNAAANASAQSEGGSESSTPRPSESDDA